MAVLFKFLGFVFSITSLFSVALASDVRVYPLCPGFNLIGDSDPGLSDVEKRLVCGDLEKSPGHSNEAWRRIPFPQAKFNLTNFLQERGYHHPIFKPKNQDRTQVDVELGQLTRVSRLQVIGTEEFVDIGRMRKVLYEPLTPAILDRIEKWVFERMRELGYGCPEVETEGDPNDGQVLIRVRTRASHPQRIVSVTEESIPGIRNGVLRRYDAFRLGDPFNGERLLVTENRVTSSRFVESTSMITDHCTEDEVYLREEVIAGPPRLLTAGFGVNTEGLLLGRASWRNTRLWQMGSLLDVSIFGSARRQTLQTFMNWYFLPEVSRFYLNPQISFDHRNEQQFETLSASTQVGLASSFETSQFGLSAFAGPTLDFYKTLRGAGAPSTRLLSLETRINLKSYPFERWINHPRAGYNLALLTSLNDQGIFSEVSAQRLNFRGEILWNLSNYDPPLWILGIRSALGVVFTPDPSTAATTLPASFFQYLGGSANIRGFGRLELPKTGGGGLTSAYLGAEMRLSNTLPYQVDPFLFVDVGGIGYSPASLDTPVYWSPGIGIRWDSPAGAVRTTLAHGFIGSDPDHVQFFFSLGEEF